MSAPKITKDNVRHEHEHIYQFTAGASELGLPVGYWPPMLETDLGNRQRLLLVSKDSERAVYQQTFGSMQLVIFAD